MYMCTLYNYFTYKFGEVDIINSHDLPLKPKLGLILVLTEINGWKARTGESKLYRIAPNLSLMWYICLRIVFCKRIFLKKTRQIDISATT